MDKDSSTIPHPEFDKLNSPLSDDEFACYFARGYRWAGDCVGVSRFVIQCWVHGYTPPSYMKRDWNTPDEPGDNTRPFQPPLLVENIDYIVRPGPRATPEYIFRLDGLLNAQQTHNRLKTANRSQHLDRYVK